MARRDAPRRQGPNRCPASRLTGGDLAAVADVLLSGPVRTGEPSASPNGPEARPPAVSEPTADPPHGLYVLVPAGVDPSRRREVALRAARCLAAGCGPAAVLFLANGRADAHVLGDIAGGRLGPRNYLAADPDRALGDLARRCDSIALVPLDASAEGVRRAGAALDRPVFLVADDEEGFVETYRTLKGWRRAGVAERAAVLYDRANGRASAWHRRLCRAAEGFLGCALALQQMPTTGVPAGDGAGVRVFSGLPADVLWDALLPATEPGNTVGLDPAPPAPAGTPVEQAIAVARGTREDGGRDSAPSADEAAGVCPAFGPWRPASREDLLAAIEAQLPALLGGMVRDAFRPGVDEPGAPPLVAVRTDGTLVAVLFGEADEFVPTRQAKAWLRIHWPLLVRACPGAGLGPEPSVTSVVLAPARPREAEDRVRRFVPVRLGGHKGIVLLP